MIPLYVNIIIGLLWWWCHHLAPSRSPSPLTPTTPPDFIVRVKIENHPVRFFVHKRPHVDFFLSMVGVALYGVGVASTRVGVALCVVVILKIVLLWPHAARYTTEWKTIYLCTHSDSSNRKLISGHFATSLFRTSTVQDTSLLGHSLIWSGKYFQCSHVLHSVEGGSDRISCGNEI